MQHSINSKIIREYDIRGIVNETLTEQDAYLIGWSFAQKTQNEYVNVGCDGRLSSPTLVKKLISGLIEGGAKVRFIGVGPTPMLYFSAFHYDAAGSIMVTGSHNPPTHNGFKFIYRNKPFFGKDIKELENISQNYNGQFVTHNNYETNDCKQAYINRISQDLTCNSELKIAWDPGNGAAGEIAKLLTSTLKGLHYLINDKIDGTFPAHHPDPTVAENLQELINLVQEKKCDLGIAFDGDGDRIGVVDKKGRIVWGDQLLLIYAEEILKKNPGATIIADIKASQKLFEGVQKLGGKPVMWKTGHSLIKTKMHETNSLLAGEMSGHIFFADRYYGFDDALYAALRLINILSEEHLSLDVIIDQFPQVYNTPEVRIDCEETEKFKIIDSIKSKLEEEGIKYNDTDGIRLSHPFGWWLLRASNTQAILVARCEADSKENLKTLKDELCRILEEFKLDVSELQ